MFGVLSDASDELLSAGAYASAEEDGAAEDAGAAEEEGALLPPQAASEAAMVIARMPAKIFFISNFLPNHSIIFRMLLACDDIIIHVFRRKSSFFMKKYSKCRFFMHLHYDFSQRSNKFCIS